MTAGGISLLLLFVVTGAPDAPPLSLQLWAIEATLEGREQPQYDSGAREALEALADLRFDTYRTLKQQRVALRAGQQSRIPLWDKYTLILHYLDRDNDGRARIAACVELAAKEPDGTPRKVVETTILLVRQGKARVGGMRTDKGEMVIVLAMQ